MRRLTHPGWLLLPLRLFLGVTFSYAGLQKLANPAYLDPHSPTSVTSQMRALRHTSPIGALLQVTTHAPTLVGLLIAFGELAVGVGTLAAFSLRLAATGGTLLSLTFFLTVSWNTTPYYYGSDIVFVFAWLTILGVGDTGVLSLHAWVTQHARQPPPRARGVRRPTAAELDRRAVMRSGLTAALLGGATLALGGVTAALGRAAGRSPTRAQPQLTPLATPSDFGSDLVRFVGADARHRDRRGGGCRGRAGEVVHRPSVRKPGLDCAPLSKHVRRVQRRVHPRRVSGSVRSVECPVRLPVPRRRVRRAHGSSAAGTTARAAAIHTGARDRGPAAGGPMSTVAPESASGVEGNSRLTAVDGMVLLVLLVVEGFTVLAVRQMITLHVYVGVLLVGPVLLKCASTGFRFVRYYARARPYVEKANTWSCFIEGRLLHSMLLKLRAF